MHRPGSTAYAAWTAMAGHLRAKHFRTAAAAALLRRTSVFAAGGNLGAGGNYSARACKVPGSPRDGTSRGACGITFEKFQDIKQGDIIEAYLMEQIEV